MEQQTWEVSVTKSEWAKFTIARDVPTEGLGAAIAAAFAYDANVGIPDVRRGPGILIERSDCTRDALHAKWEQEFYKLTKNGAKRRRFPVSQIEKDWVAYLKAERQAKRGNKDVRLERVLECGECQARWDKQSEKYGLVHVCGEGLVQSDGRSQAYLVEL